jgi:hypothetical protein
MGGCRGELQRVSDRDEVGGDLSESEPDCIAFRNATSWVGGGHGRCARVQNSQAQCRSFCRPNSQKECLRQVANVANGAKLANGANLAKKTHKAAETVVLELPSGLHTLTFRVDLKERADAQLRVELADVPGSAAQGRFVTMGTSR